jgi:hypothetical protein
MIASTALMQSCDLAERSFFVISASMTLTQIVSLSDIASISGGYSFRGRLENEADGQTLAIQMKDIEDGHVAWQKAVRLTLPGKDPKMWIEAGDVALIARGNNMGHVPISRATSTRAS